MDIMVTTNSVGLQSVFNKSSLMKGGKVGRREKGPTLCLCSSGPSRLPSQKSEVWLCPREPCHQILPLSGLRQLRAESSQTQHSPTTPLSPPTVHSTGSQLLTTRGHWLTGPLCGAHPSRQTREQGAQVLWELRSHREGERYWESRVGDRGSVLGGQMGRVGFRDLKEG